MVYMKYFMLEVVSENLMLQRFKIWRHLVRLCNKNKTGAFFYILTSCDRNNNNNINNKQAYVWFIAP